MRLAATESYLFAAADSVLGRLCLSVAETKSSWLLVLLLQGARLTAKTPEAAQLGLHSPDLINDHENLVLDQVQFSGLDNDY